MLVEVFFHIKYVETTGYNTYAKTWSWTKNQ